MEAMKGRYLRPEHDPDDDLREIGVKIRDRTKEIPEDGLAEEAMEVEAGFGLWERMKMPGLFLALVCFIGASAHLNLMDPMIAVPGMCLCSALFGWNARWR